MVPTWTEIGYARRRARRVNSRPRKILGWSLCHPPKPSELNIYAIDIAIEARRPLRGLIHHSNPGISIRQHRLRAPLPPAPGSCNRWDRVGDCFDNSMAESFFATLECEPLDKTRFRNQTDARTQIMSYIDWSRYAGDPPRPPHPTRQPVTDPLRATPPTRGPSRITTRCQPNRVSSRRHHRAS